MQFSFTRESTETASALTRGFTLVEMMVALSLFTVVMTIAAGAFLSLIGGSGQLQGEAAIMTSLNFAMDSMTREIRTGTHYYCAANAETTTSTTTVADCTAGSDSFAFVESGSSLSSGSTGGRIAYYFDSSTKKLMRQLGGDPVAKPPQAMLSSDVQINSLQFFVSGTATGANTTQPTVTVIIEAQDPDDSTGKVYTLETTVTQRELDL